MKPILSMRLYTMVMCALMVCASAPHARADDAPMVANGIVAVVNDEVITSLEVSDRVKFIIVTAKLSNDQETLQRLIPQVTRQLIDETLQLQEAKRLGINISDTQVNQALNDLATARGTSADALLQQLKDAGIATETFTDQIRAQLAWNKVVARAVRPKIKVSDEEIQLARLQAPAKLSAENSLELQLVTLALPVDKPEQDEEVKKLAEKLVADLRNGASFEDVAKQFGASGTPSAVWVPVAQMEPNMAKALEKAVPGSVSNPARTQDGYMIVKLLNRRSISSAAMNDSTLTIKDILFKMDSDATPENANLMLDIAREVARYPGTCKDEKVAGIQGMEQVNMQTQFIQAHFSELSPTVQQIVQNLSVGGISEPFASSDGIHLMMLCERVDAPPEMAETEATYAKLMNDKLDLETQKYMRNLRRDAFIEFRGR